MKFYIEYLFDILILFLEVIPDCVYIL